MPSCSLIDTRSQNSTSIRISRTTWYEPPCAHPGSAASSTQTTRLAHAEIGWRAAGRQEPRPAGERAQQVGQPRLAGCRGVERGDTGERLLGGIRGEDPEEIRNGRGRLQLRSDGRVDVLARGLRRRAKRGPRAVRLRGEQGLVERVQLGGEGGDEAGLPRVDQRRQVAEDRAGDLDVGGRLGEPGTAALVVNAGQVVAQRVLEDLELGGALAVPEAVLEAVQASEVLVVDAVRVAVGQAVDRQAQVAEAVVGSADAFPVELGGQPVLLGLGDVVAPQVGLDRGDLRRALIRDLGARPTRPDAPSTDRPPGPAR
jgi:hypothetical protein